MIVTHYGDRRTGKTTKLCQDIAAYQREHPVVMVPLTGPYVIQNRWMYMRMLHEAGANNRLVKFIHLKDLWVATRGMRGPLFVDDLEDVDYHVWREIKRVARVMDPNAKV